MKAKSATGILNKKTRAGLWVRPLTKKRICFWGIIFLLSLTPGGFAEDAIEDFSLIPIKGRVTMIDLGAEKCIPCKQMAPVLKKLETAYQGKADIVFIDVWEYREEAERFQIRYIPTQIFFDEQGNEVFRHVGFFDEKAIVQQLGKMGVEKPATLQ